MKRRLFLATFVAGDLGLVAYGALALLRPDVLVASFAAEVYRFPPDEIRAVAYLAGLFRLVGFFNLGAGLLGLLLLQRARPPRRGWILATAVAVPLLAYLGPIVFDNTVGSVGTIEIIEQALFASMVATSLLLLTDRDARRGRLRSGTRRA